jgi:type IV pilus assembly protein PilW
MRSHIHYHEEGFTLIELLIAMSMSVIILAAIFTFSIAQGQYLSTREQVTQMTQGVRAGMDMLTHELEIAGYNPTRAAFFGVTFNAAQLQLQADLNGDGDTNDANENIIYTYNAGSRQILRNTGDGNGNVPLADNMTAFTFQYLDANGNPTMVSANIRQLQITITARTAKPDQHYTSNGGYRTSTLTSFITPRNLAYQ